MDQVDSAVVDFGGGIMIELLFSILFRNYAFKIYNVPIILIARLLVNYYFENFDENSNDKDMEMLLYNMFITSLFFKILNPRTSFSFLHAVFLTMFSYLAQKHEYPLRIKKIRQDYFS